MEKINLNATPRTAGRHQTREVRSTGAVPAVLYGPSIEPQPLAIDAKELEQALQDAGSGLIPLKIGRKKTVQVLAREIQRNPIKRHILHIDFQAVSMTEKLRISVPIAQEGASDLLEGTSELLVDVTVMLVRAMDTVEIECLPTDIPNNLIADVSKLRTLEDAIYAKDLILPPGVTLITDPEQMVLGLSVARVDEEEEEEEESIFGEVDAEDVEVVARGKAKDEEEDED